MMLAAFALALLPVVVVSQKEVANDIRTSCSNPFGAGAYDNGEHFSHDGIVYECQNELVHVIGCQASSQSEMVPIDGTIVEDGIKKRCVIEKVGLKVAQCVTPQGLKKPNQEWNVNGLDKKCLPSGEVLSLGCPSGKNRRRVAVGAHYNRRGVTYVCGEEQLNQAGCVFDGRTLHFGENQYDDGLWQLQCTMGKGNVPVGCKTNKVGYKAFGERYVEDGLSKRCTKKRIELLGCNLMGIETAFFRTFDKGDLRLKCTHEGFQAVACVKDDKVYEFEDRFVDDVHMMKCTQQGIIVDENWKRTVIFVEYQSKYGDNMFLRGGLSHTRSEECDKSKPLAANPCAIPIRHITKVNETMKTYIEWSKGDLYLDWYGEEVGQGIFYGIAPAGSPMVWTTNEQGHIAYQPLNNKGPAMWMVEMLMDCSKTHDGWFEHKAWLNNWEHDMPNPASCDGTAGGQVPFNLGIDHPGRCGFINSYKFQDGRCSIDNFP